jgi:hypothetical protein
MRGHPKGVGALIVWFGPGCGCGCGCGGGGRLDVELMRQMVERGTFGLDEMAGLVQFCAGWGSGSVLLLRLFHVAVFLTGGISVMMYSPLSRRDTWSACRRIRMLEAPQRNADTDAWLEATGRELRALEVRLASAREAAAAGGGGVSQRNGHRRSAGTNAPPLSWLKNTPPDCFAQEEEEQGDHGVQGEGSSAAPTPPPMWAPLLARSVAWIVDKLEEIRRDAANCQLELLSAHLQRDGAGLEFGEQS